MEISYDNSLGLSPVKTRVLSEGVGLGVSTRGFISLFVNLGCLSLAHS